MGSRVIQVEKLVRNVACEYFLSPYAPCDGERERVPNER
jgi:hypothetical protein